jgi:hypothetical protein
MQSTDFRDLVSAAMVGNRRRLAKGGHAKKGVTIVLVNPAVPPHPPVMQQPHHLSPLIGALGRVLLIEQLHRRGLLK